MKWFEAIVEHAQDMDFPIAFSEYFDAEQWKFTSGAHLSFPPFSPAGCFSMSKGQPLQGISRFNWKDGFYSPQQLEEYKAANERLAAAKAKGKASPRPKGKKR